MRPCRNTNARASSPFAELTIQPGDDLRLRRSPDIYAAISQRGHPLVVDQTTTHDGEVSSTAQAAPLTRSAGEMSMTANLLPDLERFWPSRRCHAFDEFCRC
jgi:hypothetical protein